MGDKDEIQHKIYAISGDSIVQSVIPNCILSTGVEPEDLFQGDIRKFECSFHAEISKKDQERLMALVQFTKKEVKNMFYAVEHGGKVLFDCEWCDADNANTKYKGIACDRPSSLRRFLKHTHRTRMNYKYLLRLRGWEAIMNYKYLPDKRKE